MTLNEIRKSLGELAALKAKAGRATTAVRIRALARRGEVDRRLAELAPGLAGDASAQAEHEALVLERGRLDRVLSAG